MNVSLQVGIVPRSNRDQIPMAYERYIKADTDLGKIAADDFKEDYSRHAPIEFMGVWYVLLFVLWSQA